MGSIREKLINAAGAYSFITVTSDSKVLVEGCQQIIECTEILVRLRTNRFEVEVWGRDLFLTSFTNSSIEINGRIVSINLERRKRGESK
ncbi:MAG: YabP/YqfC family sporulation protein [Ruminococcus sp.]|nr:YabP/YqfC family sporulation protein [Ruminococcus sp.]